MLYTDSDFVTTANLTAVDGTIPAVVAACGITIDGAGGIARQCWAECGGKILETLTQFSGDVYVWPNAVSFSGFFSNSRPRVMLNNILIGSPYAFDTGIVAQWMLYYALTLLYREADGRAKNDRYEKKLNQYEDMTRRKWRSLFAQGIPLCANALSAPGALHDQRQPGTWSTTNVSTVAAGSLPTATSFDVSITWVDNTSYVGPSQNGNAESAPSTTVTTIVPANHVLSVSIASLNAPGAIPYQGGFADGIYSGRNASGWNVYAGPTGSTLTLQNSTPLPVATETYTFASTPTVTGPVMPTGQVPDARQTLQAILNRA